jgi:hypothetical protein
VAEIDSSYTSVTDANRRKEVSDRLRSILTSESWYTSAATMLRAVFRVPFLPGCNWGEDRETRRS